MNEDQATITTAVEDDAPAPVKLQVTVRKLDRLEATTAGGRAALAGFNLIS
jgi:hypothetical protein